MNAASPAFIFSAPYCGTGKLTAMLGRHPQICALPELHLFIGDSIGELFEISDLTQGLLLDGLLRAVAQLAFGAQRNDEIIRARAWLEQHQRDSIAELLAQLQAWAAPRILVIPDSQTPLRPSDLQRCAQASPAARYLHLRRHPYTQGAVFAEALKERVFVPADYKDHAHTPPQIDPQIPWLRANQNILHFLAPVDASRCLNIAAEFLESDADAALTGICSWLDVPLQPHEAVVMRDYRGWEFWPSGPSLAPRGLEAEAYEMNDVRSQRRAGAVASLTGPMPWKKDRSHFAVEVQELAAAFGYR